MSKLFVFDTNALINTHLVAASVPEAAFNKAFTLGVLVRSEQSFNEFATRFI